MHTATYGVMKGEDMHLHTLLDSPRLRQTHQLSHPPGQLIDFKKKREYLPHAENDILRKMKEAIHSPGCFPLSTLSLQN